MLKCILIKNLVFSQIIEGGVFIQYLINQNIFIDVVKYISFDK